MGKTEKLVYEMINRIKELAEETYKAVASISVELIALFQESPITHLK